MHTDQIIYTTSTQIWEPFDPQQTKVAEQPISLRLSRESIRHSRGKITLSVIGHMVVTSVKMSLNK